MSIKINYEHVAKKLALEVADLKFQTASYENLVTQLQQQLTNAESELDSLRVQAPIGDDNSDEPV